KAQMKTEKSPRPYLTVSKVGDAPVWVDKKRKAGTGYWPANDPKDGPHKHALATMKKYKPWEGKAPPKGVVLRRGPVAVEPDAPAVLALLQVALPLRRHRGLELRG